MVERFQMKTEHDWVCARPDPKGDWVRFSDYEALRAELEQVKRHNIGLHDEVQFMRNAAKENREAAERLAGSRVKALEWRGTEGVWAKADALFGATYRITEYAGMAKPFKLETIGFVGPSGHYELIDDAKAAAQADYERRVLSALAEPAGELHGPYAWLSGDRSMSEDSWMLTNDPQEISEKLFSIPLYAKVDPFKVKDGGTPDDDSNNRIERLQDAIEGECDGLAIDENQARAILDYLDTGAEPAGEAEPRACDHSVSRSEGETICVTCGSQITTPSDASAIRGALPVTGPYVYRLIRIFRSRPDDDTSAVVLQDYARAALGYGGDDA